MQWYCSRNVLSVGLGLALMVAGACDRSAAPPQSPQRERGEPSGVFTVRARVEMVPESGKPGSTFTVLHEPIDTFPNPDGTVGMNSMSMPMSIAKGVSIEALKPGDLVEVTFAAWTRPGHLEVPEVRVIKRLAPDTPLRLGKAAPPLSPDGKNK